MGYKSESLSVNVNLSNHNSDTDVEHQKLWEQLRADIVKLVDSDKYKPISPMTFG